MSDPAVSVIVVSYRVRDLLRRCLATLRDQRGVTYDVHVIDNASPDGSAGMVAAEFPEVVLVRSAENLGFARANNRLAAAARGELLAFVNPDTELPPDALATVAALFATYPRAGAAGLALDNTDGTPQPSCLAFPGGLNLLVESLGLHAILVRAGYGVPSLAPEPRGGEGLVAWVSGAFIVVRRDVFERVGGFDETIFMYGEEMDLCWRIHAAGHDVAWSGRCRVLHHGGASGVDARGALFVRNLEGRITFLRRHRGALAAAVGKAFIAVGVLLRLVFWRLVALREGSAARPRTAAQLERFEAAARWALGERS